MAYVLTYTNLVTELQSYLQRTDATFIANIPLFIMLGQRRCARDLKILGTRVVVSTTLTNNNSLLQKPTRWFNTSTFNIGTGTSFTTIVNLPFRTFEFCNIYWNNSTPPTQPKYFYDYDFNNWGVVPIPDLNYPCTIAYYEVPQLIDTTVSTNFFTQSCPDVLLYACLLETACYLKDDDRIAAWTQYYTTARDALNKEELQRMYDNYSKRTLVN
jgi:hypothetical protein